MMEEVSSSEALGSICETAWRNIPEGSYVQKLDFNVAVNMKLSVIICHFEKDYMSFVVLNCVKLYSFFFFYLSK